MVYSCIHLIYLILLERKPPLYLPRTPHIPITHVNILLFLRPVLNGTTDARNIIMPVALLMVLCRLVAAFTARGLFIKDINTEV